MGRQTRPAPSGSSENRIREVLGLGDFDLFVVTCPKDLTMFEGAIKTTSSHDRLALRELTDLIGQAMEPAELVAAGAGGGAEDDER